jgi:phosphatidylglycerophosphate synthase
VNDHLSSSEQVVAGKLKGSIFLSSSIKEFWVLELMRPIEVFCSRSSLTPNQISLIGLGLTVLAGLFFASGHLAWGGWMMISAGCCDFLDGRIARIKGLQSASGAFLDSVLDRYMDFAVLAGLLFYFQHSWVAFVVLLALLGTTTTPYMRAKSESLGIESSGGEMQRPERIVIIGVSALLSGFMMCLTYPFVPAGQALFPWLLVLGLCVVALGSNYSAWGRFRSTFLALKKMDHSNKG